MSERVPAVVVSEEDALALAFRFWSGDVTFLDELIDRIDDPQALQRIFHHAQAQKQKNLDKRERQKENASGHRQGSD
jgi:hypothetical protein